MVFFVVFGSAIRLKIFTTNSYSVQAVLYFIFGNNMIGASRRCPPPPPRACTNYCLALGFCKPDLLCFAA